MRAVQSIARPQKPQRPSIAKRGVLPPPNAPAVLAGLRIGNRLQASRLDERSDVGRFVRNADSRIKLADPNRFQQLKGSGKQACRYLPGVDECIGDLSLTEAGIPVGEQLMGVECPVWPFLVNLPA